MSAITASSTLDTSALSATESASEPAAIRNGDSAAKSAYSEGLAFEQVLLNEVTQAMAQTTSDDSDGLGGSDSSDSTTGSDALSGSAYSSLIPQTLTQSIMSSGAGSGIAMQLAESIDPALKNASTTSETSAS